MPLARLCCPACGARLPAAPGLVLFVCAECGAAAQLAGGRFAPIAHRTIRPRRDPGDRRVGLLPFWVFALGAGTARADDASPHPRRCAVPALCADNGSAFLKLGRALSLDAGPWQDWSPEIRPACGGQLAAAEAATLADTILLACESSARRCRLLERDESPWRLEAPGLVYLPFVRLGARLQDLLGGVEVTDRLLGPVPWEQTVVSTPVDTVCVSGPTA